MNKSNVKKRAIKFHEETRLISTKPLEKIVIDDVIDVQGRKELVVSKSDRYFTTISHSTGYIHYIIEREYEIAGNNNEFESTDIGRKCPADDTEIWKDYCKRLEKAGIHNPRSDFINNFPGYKI